jgi:hypothetical protein
MGKLAVPALSESLNEEDVELKKNVMMILGEIGVPSTAAVPSLARALLDSHLEVRDCAAEAIVKIGMPGASLLVGAINDQDIKIGEVLDGLSNYTRMPLRNLIDSYQASRVRKDKLMDDWDKRRGGKANLLYDDES